LSVVEILLDFRVAAALFADIRRAILKGVYESMSRRAFYCLEVGERDICVTLSDNLSVIGSCSRFFLQIRRVQENVDEASLALRNQTFFFDEK